MKLVKLKSLESAVFDPSLSNVLDKCQQNSCGAEQIQTAKNEAIEIRGYRVK